MTSNTKILDFLKDLQSISIDSFNTVEHIRDLFLKSHKDLQEHFKYGGILFSLNDTDVGGIFSYKNHISIEFSSGFSFLDPEKILEGSGKFRRHLKIRSFDDITKKKADHFIKLSVQHN